MGMKTIHFLRVKHIKNAYGGHVTQWRPPVHGMTVKRASRPKVVDLWPQASKLRL